MMTAAFMRTGTAFSLKMGGNAEGCAGRDMEALGARMTEFARKQARCGRMEHMQINCEGGRLNLVCIPKAESRGMLDEAEGIARRMQALSGKDPEQIRFWMEAV